MDPDTDNWPGPRYQPIELCEPGRVGEVKDALKTPKSVPKRGRPGVVGHGPRASQRWSVALLATIGVPHAPQK